MPTIGHIALNYQWGEKGASLTDSEVSSGYVLRPTQGWIGWFRTTTAFSRRAVLIVLAAGAAAATKPPSHERAPFLETFHRGGKTLLYIAATHHSAVAYPDARTDPVFKMIEHVFAASAPDAVIVEGVDPAVRMDRFLEYAKECAAANYKAIAPGRTCDEPTIAAYLAFQHGAALAFDGHNGQQTGCALYTGEPSAATQLQAFQKHGYSIEDFLAFWIMNNVAQEKRHGALTEDGFRKMVERVVGWENHLLGTSVQFSMEDFAAWYAQHMQTPRNYMDLVQNDGSPYPPPGAPQTIFHMLSAVSTKARDDNVVAVIKKALEAHDRVLVVYGASHLIYEWNELVELMGKPKKTKPF
jgi:hypothetical protein